MSADSLPEAEVEARHYAGVRRQAVRAAGVPGPEGRRARRWATGRRRMRGGEGMATRAMGRTTREAERAAPEAAKHIPEAARDVLEAARSPGRTERGRGGLGGA